MNVNLKDAKDANDNKSTHLKTNIHTNTSDVTVRHKWIQGTQNKQSMQKLKGNKGTWYIMSELKKKIKSKMKFAMAMKVLTVIHRGQS